MGLVKTPLFIAAAVMLLARAPVAVGCPIPVFRYALEYWEPDPYRLTVLHSGPLEAREKALAGALKEASAGRGRANIDIRLLDAAAEGAAGEPLLELVPGDELPLLVLQYPFIDGIEEPLWKGPFDAQNVDAVLRSPAREHIAGRLAGGANVWVLLPGGDRRKDAAALEVLERELARLEGILELPDPELWWTGRDSSDRPEVRFETYTLSRDDPLERHLVNMLLKSEPGLGGFGSEPMVFPVYGRGIALWAIVGKGINSWNITDAAEFLAGPCSCQVKMLNPGVDLLIEKDWESAVSKMTDWMLTPATGFAGFEAGGEEAARRLEESEAAAVFPDVKYLDTIPEAPPEKGAGAGVFIALAAVLAAAGLVLKFAGKKQR